MLEKFMVLTLVVLSDFLYKKKTNKRWIAALNFKDKVQNEILEAVKIYLTEWIKLELPWVKLTLNIHSATLSWNRDMDVHKIF